MSLKKEIQKALLLNNVNENDTVVIETDKTVVFSLNFVQMLTLLILNFAAQMQMTADDVYDFITNNFDEIQEVVITELEVTLFTFTNLYEEEPEDIVELHNKDECLLSLAVQNNVNKKLEILKERG